MDRPNELILFSGCLRDLENLENLENAPLNLENLENYHFLEKNLENLEKSLKTLKKHLIFRVIIL